MSALSPLWSSEADLQEVECAASLRTAPHTI
jgi:hypothetical protein